MSSHSTKPSSGIPPHLANKPVNLAQELAKVLTPEENQALESSLEAIHHEIDKDLQKEKRQQIIAQADEDNQPAPETFAYHDPYQQIEEEDRFGAENQMNFKIL